MIFQHKKSDLFPTVIALIKGNVAAEKGKKTQKEILREKASPFPLYRAEAEVSVSGYYPVAHVDLFCL